MSFTPEEVSRLRQVSVRLPRVKTAGTHPEPYSNYYGQDLPGASGGGLLSSTLSASPLNNWRYRLLGGQGGSGVFGDAWKHWITNSGWLTPRDTWRQGQSWDIARRNADILQSRAADADPFVNRLAAGMNANPSGFTSRLGDLAMKVTPPGGTSGVFNPSRWGEGIKAFFKPSEDPQPYAGQIQEPGVPFLEPKN